MNGKKYGMVIKMKKFLTKNKITILIVLGIVINFISGVIANIFNFSTTNSLYGFIAVILAGIPLFSGLLIYSKNIKANNPHVSNAIRVIIFFFIFVFILTSIGQLFFRFFNVKLS